MIKQKETSTGQNITKEQLEFITYPIKNGNSVILRATAGSGKTFSAVERLKFLIEKGVDPKKIIFFSFTVAAVEELKSRIKNDDIKITTIHSFCMSLLAKMGKFKKICTFYDFINWFKEKNKPKPYASQNDKDRYYRETEKLYEEAEYYSSAISAFKLQSSEGIKARIPDYFKEYSKFLKETKSRDFSDMLTEVRDALKENKWLKMFRNKYDYIFVDEYQDISSVQAIILLSLNAGYYYFIGDRAQSIYCFSGTNCTAVETLLRKRRKTIELSLSTNFRSAKLIVENSNQFSTLKAIPHHQEEGKVEKRIILFEDMVDLIKTKEEIAILARTNKVIKEIEKRLLRLKVPMRYFNYLTPSELEELKNGTERFNTKKKVSYLLDVFGNAENIVNFIEENQKSRKFASSIHKSKGREYDVCVIVNSLSPEIIEENELMLSEEQWKYLSFDPYDEDDFEAQNVHYVAVSRARKENYFMIMDV
jgi:DNA helicase-2/ATP-dependent DNA helicase PcrA